MFKRLSLLTLMFLLAACASNPSSQGGSGTQAKANLVKVNSSKGYSTIALVVVSTGQDVAPADLKKVNDNLQDAFFSKTTDETNLRQADADKADLKITVAVKTLHYVSAAKRVMFGIMAGHATLALDTELVDQKTGTKLWIDSLDTESKTSSGIFGSSTTSQVETYSQTLDDAVKTNF